MSRSQTVLGFKSPFQFNAAKIFTGDIFKIISHPQKIKKYKQMLLLLTWLFPHFRKVGYNVLCSSLLCIFRLVILWLITFLLFSKLWLADRFWSIVPLPSIKTYQEFMTGPQLLCLRRPVETVAIVAVKHVIGVGK